MISEEMTAPKVIAAVLILALRAPSALASDQDCWIPAVAMMCGFQYPTLRSALSENMYWKNLTKDQWNKIDNDSVIQKFRKHHRILPVLCERLAAFKAPVDAFGNHYFSSELVEDLNDQSKSQLDALGPSLYFYRKVLFGRVVAIFSDPRAPADQQNSLESLSSRGICNP